MKQLSEKHASSVHRVLVFGPPKSGKSLIAGVLAEFYNILWIDLENGHEVLFQLPQEWQERITLVDLPDTRSYPIGIETCLKIVKSKVDICDEHGKVSCAFCTRDYNMRKKEDETLEKSNLFTHVDLKSLSKDWIVVFDSSTQLTNSAIAHITKEEKDDYKLTFDDYGNLGKLMDIFFSHIQQASYNVIVTSHEIEAETEGKKKTLVPVAGSRNSSRNVAKYFDHVVYVERKNKKHVGYSSTAHASHILTGSRTSARIEDESMLSLLPIFKPELFDAPEPVVKPFEQMKTSSIQPIRKKGGEANAASVLAKVKSMKK